VIRYHFDLYPRTDPKNGALQVRFTGLQEAEYRSEANGTGSGRFAIRASHSDADVVLPGGSQYIRVVREDTVAVTEAVVGGFFLDQGDVTVLDDNTSHRLEFGGAGTLSVLDRAVMAPISYTGDEIQRVPDGNWAFAELFTVDTTLGAVLYRVMREALIGFRSPAVVADDREETVIGMVTLGFSRTQDSDGNAWTLSSGEFQAQVGEPVLQVVRRLMEAGLYVEMDPDTFELNAWQSASHGRDRTGLAWGTNVIRFTNPSDAVSNIGTVPNANILSQLVRGINAKLPTSHIWVGPQTDGGPYGDQRQVISVPRERFYAYESDDRDILEEIAEAQITALNEASDIVRLRYKLGADPANGLYLPFETILNDDAVTVDTTGLAVWHFTDDTYPVAAQTIKLRSGGDWEAWVDLGSPYHNISTRAFQAQPVKRHTHPPNPQLCDPARLGSTPSIVSSDIVSVIDNQHGFTSVDVDAGQSIVIFVSNKSRPGAAAEWQPTGLGIDDQALTKIADLDGAGATGHFEAWHIANPDPSSAGTVSIDNSTDADREIFAYALIDTAEAPAVFTEEGTSETSISTSYTATTGDLVLAWLGAWGVSVTGAATPGAGLSTAEAIFTGDVPSKDGMGILATATGGASADWTMDGTPEYWGHIILVFPGMPGQHLLNGTSPRAARCDHGHRYHSTSAPTVNDDSTLGFDVGDAWAQLDSLVSPTEIIAEWVLADSTDGAAVWLERETASAHIADTSDAHDASAISVLDTAANFTGTDVEAVLAELQDNIDGIAPGGGSVLDWFVVTDAAYGAVGDDTNDDTAEIQSAIDACMAAGGGTVYFPVGRYKITSKLDVDPASAMHIRFLGAAAGYQDTTGGAVVRQATTNTHGFDLTDNSDGSSFEHLGIVGPGGNSAGHGINGAKSVNTKSVVVQGFYNGLVEGSGSFYSKHYASLFDDCDFAGAVVAAGGNNADFYGCRFQRCPTGLYAARPEKLGVFGGSVEANTVGIDIDATSSSDPGRGVAIHGVYFENPSGTDIRVGNTNAVRGISIEAGKFTSTATTHINLAKVDGAWIAGNSFDGGKSKVTGTTGSNVVLGPNYGTGSYGSMPAGTVDLLALDHGADLDGLADDDHTQYLNEARHSALDHGSTGGELLISDTPSTPLVFADLIQNEAQDDLVYAD
jgi:hypothetical protein